MNKIIKKLNFLLLTFGLLSSVNFLHVHAESISNGDYNLTISSDKIEVKVKEEFNITISVKNVGKKAIENFEIRMPFYDRVADAKIVEVDPSFNKLLVDGFYPDGFNSKSWLINNLDSGQEKSYIIKYKIDDSPVTPNGLVALFTYPMTWTDPSGVRSGMLQTLNYLRADIYINGLYHSSVKQSLPKLQALDTEISLIELNKKYYFEGSKSTDLKTITKSNISSFPDFKLDTQDVLIEWLEPIDFSNKEVIEKLAKLDTYLNQAWGKLDFDSTELNFLSKKAKITFKNIYFLGNPKIKVGGQIVKLEELKGVLNKSDKTVIIELNKLEKALVYPNIQIDKSQITTSEKNLNLKIKEVNPEATISYSLNGGDKNSVLGIDLANGEFNIKIDDTTKTKNVEIVSKYKNGEEGRKIVEINYQQDTTPTPAPIAKPQSESILVNTFTIILVLAAVALIIIILGLMYYLNSKKKKELDDHGGSSAFSDLKINSSAIDIRKTLNLENDNLENRLRRNNEDLLRKKYGNNGSNSEESTEIDLSRIKKDMDKEDDSKTVLSKE